MHAHPVAVTGIEEAAIATAALLLALAGACVILLVNWWRRHPPPPIPPLFPPAPSPGAPDWPTPCTDFRVTRYDFETDQYTLEWGTGQTTELSGTILKAIASVVDAVEGIFHVEKKI